MRKTTENTIAVFYLCVLAFIGGAMYTETKYKLPEQPAVNLTDPLQEWRDAKLRQLQGCPKAGEMDDTKGTIPQDELVRNLH